MKKIILLFTLSLLVQVAWSHHEDVLNNYGSEELNMSSLHASMVSDTFTLSAPSTNAGPGETVCFPISVCGFKNLLTVQFSMSWDPGLMHFEDLQNINLPPGTDIFGTPPATAPGSFTFSYDVDDIINGKSLPDSSVIFELCFRIDGSNGDCAVLEFSSSPTVIEVVDIAGAFLDVRHNDGKINIQSIQDNNYVSLQGNDNNDGTLDNPWRTIQHAIEQLGSGDTLNILEGTYDGGIDISDFDANHDGMVIRSYQNDEVTITGAGLDDYGSLIKIEEAHHVVIQNLKFKNYQKLDAQGIAVINSSNVSILNNEFENIDYAPDAVGETPVGNQNSQPIIVYGRDPDQAITDLLIAGNIVHSCEVGFSECIAVNGNVDGFEISNNQVYNNSNIGIVAIGHEGECPDPSVDRARNGEIFGNVVYNNHSPYAAAAGIYIDGGNTIRVHKNNTFENDYGIEIGCENNGSAPNASAGVIIVFDNLVHSNRFTGIAAGSYNYPTTGRVAQVFITNNTCYNNDLEDNYNGEIYISHIELSTVANNIFYATNEDDVLFISEEANPTLTLEHNIFFNESGNDYIVIEWDGEEYNTFDDYQNDRGGLNSLYADPFFTTTTAPFDFNLQPGSAAIDQGNDIYCDNEGVDIFGNPRVDNIVDCGAVEYSSPTSIHPETINEQISIFPNPASSFIRIESALSIDAFKLYHIDGTFVKKGLLNGLSQSIDISRLPQGIYLLRLVVGEEIYITKVMVI